jgi:ABC-type glutathione transport system ATPase component
LLHIRLSIDYPGRPRVLEDAMLDVRPGEIVGLIGESGSGKSSLALALLRLLDLKGGRASGNI